MISIEESLESISKSHGLISTEQQRALLKDIKYLLLDNIARKVKLRFYSPADNSPILEYVYTAAGQTEIENTAVRKRVVASSNIAIDILCEFTDAFLAMGEEIQKKLLNNTEFKWYPAD